MNLTSGVGICNPYKSYVLDKCSNRSRSIICNNNGGIKLYSIKTCCDWSRVYVVEVKECERFREFLECKFSDSFPSDVNVLSAIFTRADVYGIKRLSLKSCSPKEASTRLYRMLEYIRKCQK